MASLYLLLLHQKGEGTAIKYMVMSEIGAP